MKTRFDIHFMDEAWHFIQSLDAKIKAKVTSNMEKSRETIDPELFRKLNKNIWEFKTKYAKRQVRLFAFWSPIEKSMIVCTHGIFKRTQKTPLKEILKAQRLRTSYLNKH